MSINMSATNLPSRFGSLFQKNGTDPANNNGLSARLEEQATTSERTIRAATGGAAQAASTEAVAPNQITKARRHRYSRDEKLRILRLADACKERGQLGALLRREGIYYSTLRDFEQQRANGRLEVGYQKDKRAARDEDNEDKKHIAQLEAQNRQLTHRLEQAQIIIDVQKKLSQLLGVTLPQTQQSNPTL
jgi:transposase-like protein